MAAALAATPALAAPPKTPVATARAFLAAFDAHDIDAIVALCAPDVSIVDEFQPYAWRGADACRAYGEAAKATSTAEHESNQVDHLGAPTASSIKGDLAYLSFPDRATWSKDGKAMEELGRQAFVLRRQDRAWKIVSTAWAGGKEHPVASAAPAAPAKP